MWCRLLTGEQAGQAQPIDWRQAVFAPGPASGAVPAAAPRLLYTDPGPATPPEQEKAEAAAALRDAERRIEEAYHRGLKEGEAADAQRNARIDQLGRSIEQLAMHRTKIHREAEPELVRLSLAIARRIMRRELSVDPESLQGLLKVGLEKIEASETHRVRVHPKHAVILKSLLQDAARPIEVASDPGLPVGAVIFETSRGSVDTGMETQLKEIERGFSDLYPK
jgi:flagellar assembly protein FliH